MSDDKLNSDEITAVVFPFYPNDSFHYSEKIKKSDIVSMNDDEMEFYKTDLSSSQQPSDAIELKQNREICKVKIKVKLQVVLRKFNFWKLVDSVEISRVLEEVKTPWMDYRELGTYKLIETEAEFDDYMQSNISCDDWCRKKLAETMLALGLGKGFVNGFADLIGTDLKRYHDMLELAKECNSKDILMYLLVEKYKD